MCVHVCSVCIVCMCVCACVHMYMCVCMCVVCMVREQTYSLSQSAHCASPCAGGVPADLHNTSMAQGVGINKDGSRGGINKDGSRGASIRMAQGGHQ